MHPSKSGGLRTWATLLAASASLGLSAVAAEPYREPHRPQFHFTPERNWMNDPNGMVYFDGEYHLFYQHNPFGDRWGHMSWGHAVSRDLVRWEHLPVALAEENGVMIFSGSTVVDWKNTSGFGKSGRPPLVAVYTGHYTEKPLQNQHIAYSNDRGRTWTKYDGNPVLDLGMKDFRDPKVFWHKPTDRWIMTVALPTERKVRFFASPNLKEWTPLSDFGPAGSTHGIWECPDLFQLEVGGKSSGRFWVLVVNVGSGAPAGGSGCQYFVGYFDGTQFTVDITSQPLPTEPESEPALWADFGPDFYAAVSWSDVPRRDGRRLWLAWMSNWVYANDVPTAPWRSAMTLPRALELRRTGNGLRMVQAPVRELARLKGKRNRWRGGTVGEANAWVREHGIGGELFAMDLEFDASSAAQFGLKFRQGAGQETVLRCDTKRGRLILDRTRSGGAGFHPKFAGTYEAPVGWYNRRIRLRLWVDSSSVEIVANDGEPSITALLLPEADSRALEFFGDESCKIGRVDFWPMTGIWQ